MYSGSASVCVCTRVSVYLQIDLSIQYMLKVCVLVSYSLRINFSIPYKYARAHMRIVIEKR